MMTAEQAQEEEKQAWLEQQKMEWFDKRRARWEAAGKPTPWAQWIGKLEVEWATSELPSRELAWPKQFAEHKLAQMFPSTEWEAEQSTSLP